jgi:hypothetical protein
MDEEKEKVIETAIVPQLPEVENPTPLANIANVKKAIVSRKCAVCNSKVRLEVEALYDKGETLPKIRAHMESVGEAVAEHRIKYHFQAHYKNQLVECAIEEHIASMEEMTKRRRSRLDDLEYTINESWMQYFRIIGLPTNGDMQKEVMRQKMMVEIMDVIFRGYEEIRKTQDSEARFGALKLAFDQIWGAKMLEAKTKEECDLIKNTLKDFDRRWAETKID